MSYSRSMRGPTIQTTPRSAQPSDRVLLAGLLVVGCLAWSAAMAGDLTQLTHDGLLKRDLRFLGNGAELVYGVDEGAALVRLMRLNLADGTAQPFFEDVASKHQVEPAFSPDEKIITFTECTGNLTARLVIRNLETRKDAYVGHSGRGGTRSPIFSRDGERVIYAFAETGPQQLWSVNLEGKDKKQITQTEGITNWPTITADGKTDTVLVALTI